MAAVQKVGPGLRMVSPRTRAQRASLVSSVRRVRSSGDKLIRFRNRLEMQENVMIAESI